MRICIVCSLDHRPRTAHRAPRTAHRAPPTAHRLPPTAHHAPPTAHRGSCRCGGPRCEALPSIKIRLQTVYKVRHDALPHGTLVRAPSDESVGAARPESRCTRLTGRAREHTGGAVGGEEGGAKRQGAREHTRVSSLTACQPRSCTTCSRGGGQRSAAREHGVWRASWMWARTASSRVC